MRLVWNYHGRIASKFIYSFRFEVPAFGFDGCGIIVISSLIFSGFNNESLLFRDAWTLFFFSITRFATTLCAEYTWLSNCLYMPNVAVHTVHLYDKWAGFKVILWSRATWFNNFHWYTCRTKSKLKSDSTNYFFINIFSSYWLVNFRIYRSEQILTQSLNTRPIPNDLEIRFFSSMSRHPLSRLFSYSDRLNYW